MSGELCSPVGQPVPASPADRARRKAWRQSCSIVEFIGVLDEVALESDDDNCFGVDEEIDTLSSGSQIDKTSTSPAGDTCSDGDEKSKTARYVDAAVSGAITSGTNLTLTDVQAAIAKGCDC